MNNNDEIDFGRGPITVIVRWTQADKRSALRQTRLTDLEIAQALGHPQWAWCQRIDHNHHRYWISLPASQSWLEMHVCSHTTETYQMIDAHPLTQRYTLPVLEGPETLYREIQFRLIDLETGGRENFGTDAQVQLYKQVEALPFSPLTAPEADHNIWSAFLEAQMRLVTALEAPYPIKWPPRREHGNNSHPNGQGDKASADIRLTFDLPQSGPGKQQDNGLKHALADLSWDQPGKPWHQLKLTRKEIATLDKLLEGEYAGEWRRGPNLRVVTKIQSQGRQQGFRTPEAFAAELNARIREAKLKVEYKHEKQIITFEFDHWEQLDEICAKIERWNIVSMTPSPRNSAFKFNVSLEPLRKSEEMVAEERLKRLFGAEFLLEMPPIDGKPSKAIFAGKLDRRGSSPQKLVIRVPMGRKGDQENAKPLLDLLDDPSEKERPTHLRANLTGDRAKLSWLEEAIHKVEAPKDSPNGKPVNENLGDFLFNSGKARPIYDKEKQTRLGEAAKQLRRRQLLQLNDSQAEAVRAALYAPDMALVQGPPGTGKTTVIAEMIWQLIIENPGTRILLTSETNLAVDNALDRLLQAKGAPKDLARMITLVKPLRFGRLSKIDEEGAKYAFHRIRQWADPSYKPPKEEVYALDERDDDEDETQAPRHDRNAVQEWMIKIGERVPLSEQTTDGITAVLQKWQQDLAQPDHPLKETFTNAYLRHANVIGSTCSSAGSPSLMWDIAEHVLGHAHQHIEDLRKAFHSAQKFGRVNPTQLPKGVQIPYEKMEEQTRKYRRADAERKQAKQQLQHQGIVKGFETVDGRPLLQDHDRELDRLSSHQDLLRFTRQEIAPYFHVGLQFDVVIMDEASKATPPELLLPLCFGKRVVIIGDHRQLPPMLNEVEFREALTEVGAHDLAAQIDKKFTEVSQFERLILNKNVSPHIIARCNEQYRMHPDINAVIEQFYRDEGGLRPAEILTKNADLADLNHAFSRHHGLFLPQFIDPGVHTIWVDVAGEESQQNTSVENAQEVEAVKRVIQLLESAEGWPHYQQHWDQVRDPFLKRQEQEIGVISFYAAQRRKLREGLKGVKTPLKVNTVDRFQGMERNIVIVSTVRAQRRLGSTQPNTNSGFAKSPNRLNVALSRARRLLIVVGDRRFFEQVKDNNGHPLYSEAIQAIEKHGRILTFQDLPTARPS